MVMVGEELFLNYLYNQNSNNKEFSDNLAGLGITQGLESSWKCNHIDWKLFYLFEQQLNSGSYRWMGLVVFC